MDIGAVEEDKEKNKQEIISANFQQNPKIFEILDHLFRYDLSDSYPAFFLLIATTSNKKNFFKSAETVNVKFGVYGFGDKGQ
jgi:hypothetical protein